MVAFHDYQIVKLKQKVIDAYGISRVRTPVGVLEKNATDIGRFSVHAKLRS